MMNKNVIIIDYGMGNIQSVANAFRYLGASVCITDSIKDILSAEYLILPGVGSFRKAVEIIRTKRLDLAIKETLARKSTRLLGICLGMQLLASVGTEDGETAGLGFIDTRVEEFQPSELHGLKVPHVGFDTVHFSDQNGLFRNLPINSDFYFTHSYRILADSTSFFNYGTCTYGVKFLAAFEINNIYGVQFHPEKSQTNGLLLLRNFLEI
jgi:glutamine amidotransferase